MARSILPQQNSFSSPVYRLPGAFRHLEIRPWCLGLVSAIGWNLSRSKIFVHFLGLWKIINLLRSIDFWLYSHLLVTDLHWEILWLEYIMFPDHVCFDICRCSNWLMKLKGRVWDGSLSVVFARLFGFQDFGSVQLLTFSIPHDWILKHRIAQSDSDFSGSYR